MYFVKTFTNSEVWKQMFAEFKCDNCGNVEWVRVKENKVNKEPIKCPDCNSMGKEDFKTTLINKKNILEQEKEKLQNEIDNLISEIDNINAMV